MSNRNNHLCPSCGVSWIKHGSIMATCEELLKLREELAAARRKLRAGSTSKCSVAIQDAELRRELEELRTIRDTLFAHIASQRFQPKPEPKKGKQ